MIDEKKIGYIAVQKTGSYCFPDSTNKHLSDLGLSMDFIDYTHQIEGAFVKKTSWDRVFIFD
jgi:hypothetical protein